MKTIRLAAALLALCFLLTACGSQTPAVDDTPSSGTQQTNPDNTQETDKETGSTVTSDSDMFTARDLRTTYDESKAALITLGGTTASSTSNAVSVKGNTVTILDEGTYLLTGTWTGQIVVDAPKDAKTQIVLRNAAIHCESSAALYVKEADKVFVTLEGENTLSCGESFTAVDESNIDGAVYAKADLTFNGSGKLTVTAPAGHGIVAKDDLVFVGGSYDITSASHGVDANDSVRITGAGQTDPLTRSPDRIHGHRLDI